MAASIVGSTTINGQPAYLMSDGSRVIQQNSTPANANRSTVYGTQSNTNARPAANLGGGSVLGASTGGGGGGGNPQQSQPSAPAVPSFDDIINDAFSGTVSFLDQQAGALRGQLPGIESDINSMYGESRNTLAADKVAGERQLATAEQGGVERKEDAISSARRLYNELQMGGNQRFGGASSAGEAYQALAGRELQRNNQQIATDFSSFMGQIEGARTSINEKYTLAVQNLESQKNRMLSEARRDLQNKLLEIDRQKAMAQQEKANRKLEALQSMRNQIYQIQLASSQGISNAQAIKQQLEGELTTYAQSQSQALQQGTQAGDTFSQGLDMTPQTDLSMGFGGGQIASLPTGVRKEDELNPMGAIYNPRPRYDQGLV